MFEEEFDGANVSFSNSVEDGCFAVVITGVVVSSCLDQEFYTVFLAQENGSVERSFLVRTSRGIDLGSSCDQQLHIVDPVCVHGTMQRCLSLVAWSIDDRTCIEQKLHRLCIAPVFSIIIATQGSEELPERKRR
jgi:hypothetical protein